MKFGREVIVIVVIVLIPRDDNNNDDNNNDDDDSREILVGFEFSVLTQISFEPTCGHDIVGSRNNGFLVRV